MSNINKTCCSANKIETPKNNCCCHKHEKKEQTCCSSKGSLKGCCCSNASYGTIKLSTKLLLSAIALIISFCISHFKWNFVGFPYTDPAWIAVLLCAGDIFKGAFITFFKEGKIVTSMLVSIAMIASFMLQIFTIFGVDVGGHHESYIFVVGEIAFLMSLGEWLEERTISRTQKGLQSLANMMPKTSRVRRNDNIIEINASEILVGDTVCVAPHEMISADGKIILGSTSINQANITGESMPVEKTIGDTVLCGTFNEDSYIEIQAEKTGCQTTLSQMLELIDEAEGKKAPIARIASKWATYIVPSALGLSLITLLVARFILDTSLIEAIVRATTILVVFCPCAFVLATPTAISAGIGNASKNGILIKSGEALERLSKITTAFFDKTGTLTTGKIKVEKFTTTYPDEDFILEAVVAIEKDSTHPIAKAIIDFANTKTKTSLLAKNVQAQTGIGISGLVNDKKVEIKKAQTENSQTMSNVYIDNNLVANFYFSDTLRSSAKSSIKTLNEHGIATALLSGDNLSSVSSIAEEVGIKTYSANLLPQDKLNVINKTQSEGEFVCMIGDGVNDTPSFVASDISIAISDIKNDIAINTAQVVILDGELRKIPALIDFSKTVMLTITINIIFSLTLSLTAVMLGMFGIITPAIGAIIHNISSVSVVANSARLLNKQTLKFNKTK
ncbi:MAG: cadmium-translocating P-type ATPase [Verrucomicrobiaceae bacterium]|nr:cadmium-translocating P-type ATPase [Verrucomicrobiaceae bacterium]